MANVIPITIAIAKNVCFKIFIVLFFLYGFFNALGEEEKLRPLTIKQSGCHGQSLDAYAADIVGTYVKPALTVRAYYGITAFSYEIVNFATICAFSMIDARPRAN